MYRVALAAGFVAGCVGEFVTTWQDNNVNFFPTAAKPGKLFAAESVGKGLSVKGRRELLIGVSGIANVVTFSNVTATNGGRRLKGKAGGDSSGGGGGGGSTNAEPFKTGTIGFEIRYKKRGRGAGPSAASDVCGSGVQAAPGEVFLASAQQTLEVDVNLELVDAPDVTLNESIKDLLDIEGELTVAIGLQSTSAHHYYFIVPDMDSDDTDVAACYTSSGSVQAKTPTSTSRSMVSVSRRMATMQDVQAVKDHFVDGGQQNGASAKFSAGWEQDSVSLYSAHHGSASNTLATEVLAAIKAPADSELLIGVSGIVNLVTFTKTMASNGEGMSTTVAEGTVGLKVKYAPTGTENICDNGVGSLAAPGEITFASRKQSLSVEVDLDVINTTADSYNLSQLLDIEGNVTVAFGLDTTSAHTFHFVATDLQDSAMYDVVACFTGGGSVTLDGSDDTDEARSMVAVYSRVVTIQQVRAVSQDFVDADQAGSAKFTASYETDSVALFEWETGSDASSQVGEVLTTIKVPNKVELLVGVSGLANIVTLTTAVARVKGKEPAQTSTVSAEGTMGLKVKYGPKGQSNICQYGTYAKPGDIVFASRHQTLSVKADLRLVDAPGVPLNESIADLLDISGSITVGLGLDTVAAHHFNFVIPDLYPGEYDVVACFDGSGSISVSDEDTGSSARSFVAVGKRMVTVQEVRADHNAFQPAAAVAEEDSSEASVGIIAGGAAAGVVAVGGAILAAKKVLSGSASTAGGSV